MIIGIVAVSRNLAIGRNGSLPWHYSADLKFFKRTTSGNTVVMGSTTWKGIGKPLPNRLNIVLSRDPAITAPSGTIRLHAIDEIILLERYLRGDVFVIGGAEVFGAFGPIIDEWLVTDIPHEVPDADTFMPSDFLHDFEIVEGKDLGDGLLVRRLRRRGESV